MRMACCKNIPLYSGRPCFTCKQTLIVSIICLQAEKSAAALAALVGLPFEEEHTLSSPIKAYRPNPLETSSATVDKPAPVTRQQVPVKSASLEELISAALTSTSPMPSVTPRKARPHRIGKLEAKAIKAAKAAVEQPWSNPHATVRHLGQQVAAAATTTAVSAPAAQPRSRSSKVPTFQAHLDAKIARQLKFEVSGTAEGAAIRRWTHL